MTRKKPAPKPAKKADAPFFRPFAAVAKATKPAQPTKGRDVPATHAAPKPKPGDGELSFEELLYGIDKLKPGKAAAKHLPVAAPDPDHDEAMGRLRKLVEGGDSRFEVSDDGRRIEGRRVDVDSAVVRKLRRGEYPLDGSLDLHGLDVATAREKLESFVKLSRARGERTLLVIHGRGKHSPGGKAILRGEVASWLSQGRESALVAAFCSALPDDGGDGAMYVRLR